MKLFSKGKDGGPESTVTGYWLIEAKKLFSVVLLKFEGASREAYHNHAFNSVSWLLRGKLYEWLTDGDVNIHYPFWVPILTKRSTFHKVDSVDCTSWVLSFRGPWAETWNELRPEGPVTLTNGRVEI